MYNKNSQNLAKAFLGATVYEALNKALEKLNTRSVIDLQELHATIKTVPKSILVFLLKELKPMIKDEAKEIKLPYHNNAIMLINKHGDDVYAGHIAQDGKIVHEFNLVSIPQLAAHILSQYELYDLIDQDSETKESSVKEEPSTKEATKQDLGAEKSEKIEQLSQDLLSEKIKTLEAKIDQIMVMLANQKSSDAIEKAEPSELANKFRQILNSKSLNKAGLMPKMPNPPGAGTKAGMQGITRGGLHGDKTAATDLPGHAAPTGVKDPHVKAPGKPAQMAQPKQPKTQFTAKSEGSTTCSDCRQPLVKSGIYKGCVCFKALTFPELKKNTNGTTTFSFSDDWDEDARLALWVALRKK